MQEEEQASTTWWVFYPFKGLDIANSRPDLQNPMFADATIISKRHLADLVPLLKLNEEMANGHDHERDVLFLLEHATFREDYQSLIAVRRTGVLPQKERTPRFLRSASERAYQIAAIVSLVFLARSSSGQTCGFVEQLYRNMQTKAMLDFQHGGFSFQLGSARSRASLTGTIKVSRSQLKKILAQKRFSGLTSAVLPQSPSLPRSLRNAITQSAIRLSDAVHTPMPSAQLLGAITSLEILLSYQGDSYETIKRRLVALLGSEAVRQYSIDSILRARHLYVHNGEPVKGNETLANALALALSCLLRYAEAAPNFSSKTVIFPR